MRIKIYARVVAAGRGAFVLGPLIFAAHICLSNVQATKAEAYAMYLIMISLGVFLSLSFLPGFLAVLSLKRDDVFLTDQGICYKPLNNPQTDLFLPWDAIHSVWVGWKKGVAVSMKLKRPLEIDIPENTVFKLDGDELHLKSAGVFAWNWKISRYMHNAIWKMRSSS